jgi:hypothetical protein
VTSDDDRIEIFEDTSGQYQWHRVSSNNEIISRGESHAKRDNARRAAWRANPDLAGDELRTTFVEEELAGNADPREGAEPTE